MTTPKTRSHGWLAFGVFYSGDDEDDICTVGENWQKRLCRRKRADKLISAFEEF